jgi:hypothetical protein
MRYLPDTTDRRPAAVDRQLERFRQRTEIETYKQYLAIKADQAVAEYVNRGTADLAHEAIDEIDWLTHRGRQTVSRNSDAEIGAAAIVTEAELAMARVMRRFTSRQLDRLG